MCSSDLTAKHRAELGLCDCAHFAPLLEEMSTITEAEFRAMFRGTPVSRARYRGFLRNVAVAMGNAGAEKFRGPLEALARSEDAVVAEHALWALGRLTAASSG